MSSGRCWVSFGVFIMDYWRLYRCMSTKRSKWYTSVAPMGTSIHGRSVPMDLRLMSIVINPVAVLSYHWLRERDIRCVILWYKRSMSELKLDLPANLWLRRWHCPVLGRPAADWIDENRDPTLLGSATSSIGQLHQRRRHRQRIVGLDSLRRPGALVAVECACGPRGGGHENGWWVFVCAFCRWLSVADKAVDDQWIPFSAILRDDLVVSGGNSPKLYLWDLSGQLNSEISLSSTNNVYDLLHRQQSDGNVGDCNDFFLCGWGASVELYSDIGYRKRILELWMGNKFVVLTLAVRWGRIYIGLVWKMRCSGVFQHFCVNSGR